MRRLRRSPGRSGSLSGIRFLLSAMTDTEAIAEEAGSPPSGSSPAAVEPRLRYQPALDGMRGLAVAAVLAYHAGLPWARGGFLGVDAFFVLSGYLITSLLLTERRATGAISLGAFWARRARRLLPALFLVLVGVMGYAVVFAEQEELTRLRHDAIATLAYVANWRAVFSGESYFEQFAVPSPLRHTWSLAIEEQWYLVWPILVIALLRWRRGSVAALLGLSLAMAAGSALLMVWLFDPHGDPSRVYYGTDTRAQSLLVGAALAAWLIRDRPTFNTQLLQAAGLACMVVIGWAWIVTPESSQLLYRGGFLLLALSVAVVIVAAVAPKRGLVKNFLSFAPLRGLGLISYGVYLWHWPLYLVLTPERTGWDGHGLFVVRVLATLAVAIASYYIIEVPFRRGGLWRWRASWVLAPAAGAVLVIGILFVTRVSEPIFALPTASSLPPPPSVSTPISEDTLDTTRAPIRVLAVGDSVAFTMAQGLVRAESAWNLSVWNTAKLGCGVLRADEILLDGTWSPQGDFCKSWPTRWRSHVEVFQPDVVVLLAGAWDLYDRKVGERVLEFGTTEGDAFVLGELDAAVDVLSSGGATVMLLTTPYYEARELGLNTSGVRFDRARIERLNLLYAELAEQRGAAVSVLNLNGFVGSESEREADGGNAQMRHDGVHFSDEGADTVARWLAPLITEAAGPPRNVLSAPPLSAGAVQPQPPARWLELLAHVPDTDDTRLMTVMNDYARFRQAWQVPLPATDANEILLFEYYRRLLFSPDGKPMGLVPANATGIAGSPSPLVEFRMLLGFTIADVDQDIRAGDVATGPRFEILRGRFDLARIDEALRTNPLVDALAGSAAGGGRYHLWRSGGQYAAVLPPPALTQSQAAVGDYLYRASAIEDVEATIEAAAGERRSLADIDDFERLARGLEALGTYTALFSVDTNAYTVAAAAERLAGTEATEDEVAAERERIGGETKLLPYQAFATGAGLDVDGPYTALVLLNPDVKTARANVQRLEDRIAEGISWLGGQPFREFIEHVEITREGRVILAKLRTDRYALWFGLHAGRDTLLIHE